MYDDIYDPDAREGKPVSVAVIGLGNPLMSDDGAGLTLWKAVKESRDWDNRVLFEDGGTSGMMMLPLVEDARAVVFLDAARTGAAPGTVIVRRDDEIPAWFSQMLSPHQIGLKDVLGAAQLRGFMPEKIALIGIEAESIDFAYKLTDTIQAAIPEATEIASREILSLLDYLDRTCEPCTK